jgi:hypothetical protein
VISVESPAMEEESDVVEIPVDAHASTRVSHVPAMAHGAGTG